MDKETYFFLKFVCLSISHGSIYEAYKCYSILEKES